MWLNGEQHWFVDPSFIYYNYVFYNDLFYQFNCLTALVTKQVPQLEKLIVQLLSLIDYLGDWCNFVILADLCNKN